MKSSEAASRLAQIAALLESLGDDGYVQHLGCVNMPANGVRSLLIVVELKETKKHAALFDRALRIAHSVENTGPEQLQLQLDDDLLTQHLRRK